MGKLTTTLANLRRADVCRGDLQRFRAANPKVTDDTPITLGQILDSNGIQDALWCLRMWPQYDREWRLFACKCAESVSHLWNNPACAHAVTTARKYANGLCGEDELSAACSAARDAWASAWNAEMDAANAAAMDAAKAAANAANAEARAAALAAAWAAASAAAWYVANAARDAARAAANAANAEARAAILAKQTEMLRGVIREIENG